MMKSYASCAAARGGVCGVSGIKTQKKNKRAPMKGHEKRALGKRAPEKRAPATVADMVKNLQEDNPAYFRQNTFSFLSSQNDVEERRW